jgi:glycosyltransferase involved in cell wall biosynthesis
MGHPGAVQGRFLTLFTAVSRIKIAFFAEILIEDFDGAARTMFQLLKRVRAAEVEFLFICGVGPDQLFGFPCIRLPTVTIPFNSRYKMALPGLRKRTLTRQLEAFAPDLVHIATPSSLGTFAQAFARHKGIPVLSIYHTHFISYVDYYLRSLPFLIKPVKHRISRFQRDFYNGCDIVYVPSESIVAELAAMGIENRRMLLWKRGMDTNLFTPDKRDVSRMYQWFGNTNPVVLFLSRLVWEKNLETLIRVYERCQARQLSVNFLVVGDGTAATECRRRMPGAIFPGALGHEEASVVYASADVFLFPSISESYGNVVLEALASGLPCVVADGGGSRDFIEPGKNGFLCRPNDADDYVDKIDILLKDNTLQQAMSVAGRQYSKQFDWDELAARYVGDVTRLTTKI